MGQLAPGSCPITFLWLWTATDHKPHCRHVPISKTWRQTESTPRSGLRRSHKEQLVRTRDNLESRRTCRDAVQVRTVTALNCQSQLGQSHQPVPRLPPTHTTWPAPRDTPVQQVTWYQLGRGHQPVPCHPPTHITWPAPTYTPVQQLMHDLSFTCMLQAYLEQDKMLCYCMKKHRAMHYGPSPDPRQTQVRAWIRPGPGCQLRPWFCPILDTVTWPYPWHWPRLYLSP